MTCKDCIHYDTCYHIEHYGRLVETDEPCGGFKNKADFVEVVRCKNCKHGDVATISKSKDGEETIACYCKLKGRVTDVDSYCPSGERKETKSEDSN